MQSGQKPKWRTKRTITNCRQPMQTNPLPIINSIIYVRMSASCEQLPLHIYLHPNRKLMKPVLLAWKTIQTCCVMTTCYPPVVPSTCCVSLSPPSLGPLFLWISIWLSVARGKGRLVLRSFPHHLASERSLCILMLFRTNKWISWNFTNFPTISWAKI